jgi:hypothetical protein
MVTQSADGNSTVERAAHTQSVMTSMMVPVTVRTNSSPPGSTRALVPASAELRASLAAATAASWLWPVETSRHSVSPGAFKLTLLLDPVSFDPGLFDHLEMGIDQCDKFTAMVCRSALILGEFSEDEGAQSAQYMAGLSHGTLPVFELPETYHHMTFDDPLAMTAAIKGLTWSWLSEDYRTGARGP